MTQVWVHSEMSHGALTFFSKKFIGQAKLFLVQFLSSILEESIRPCTKFFIQILSIKYVIINYQN